MIARAGRALVARCPIPQGGLGESLPDGAGLAARRMRFEISDLRLQKGTQTSTPQVHATHPLALKKLLTPAYSFPETPARSASSNTHVFDPWWFAWGAGWNATCLRAGREVWPSHLR
jgi:hypothetical protein